MNTQSLMGQQNVESALKLAMELSDAQQTEVALWAGAWGLTRFANSAIHQNMTGQDAVMRVRAVFGKKIASATTNRIDEDGIREVVSRAVNMARLTDENPDFVSLPEPHAQPPKVETYFDSTAKFGPEQRAEAVRKVVQEAEKVGGTAAGSFVVRKYEQGIANSLGINSYFAATDARLVTVVTGQEGGFGYGAANSRNVEDIDPLVVGAEAAYRAAESRNPVAIEPGEYECILMPYASAELLDMLRYMGFRALAYQEGRSFMCGKIGEKIVSEKVSIYDDGGDPRTQAVPYDGEGVAKQRVDIIKSGVATGLLYDSYSAHREGKKSTGHAYSGAPGEIGVSGGNLIMAPGDASVEQMIASTKRGILVTRFHYTNVAHLMTASITGMTRNGTFLIEDGRIITPSGTCALRRAYWRRCRAPIWLEAILSWSKTFWRRR